MNLQRPNAQDVTRMRAHFQALRSHQVQLACNRIAKVDVARCYFLKLPTVLRQEIFKYLMPEHPITSEMTNNLMRPSGISKVSGSLVTKMTMRLTDLFLGFNRETYEEIKYMFYSTARFVVGISRDGVTLCGQTIIQPTGRHGSHFQHLDERRTSRFVQNFDWAAVRNYNIRVTIGREDGYRGAYKIRNCNAAGEVQLYDLRETVSRFLSKARQINHLQVSLVITQLDTTPDSTQALDYTKVIIPPLGQLCRVCKPRLIGVTYEQKPPSYGYARPTRLDVTRILGPGMLEFDAFATEWAQCLSSDTPAVDPASRTLVGMFEEFKKLYERLSKLTPRIARHGKACFLHRARVAREQEDGDAFRTVAADLMGFWREHLQQQEAERKEVEGALQRMIG